MTKQAIRNALTSAAPYGVGAVVAAFEKLGDGAGYALDWLSTYGAGTWQAKALAAINADVYGE